MLIANGLFYIHTEFPSNNMKIYQYLLKVIWAGKAGIEIFHAYVCVIVVKLGQIFSGYNKVEI